MRHLTLLLCLLAALPAAAADVPALTLLAPADGTTTFVTVDTPGFPNVGLGVQFQVTGWVYPAANKGVLFGLDAWTANEEPLVVAQGPNVAFVSPIPAGQHTLWACLATLNAGLWSPLDVDDGQPGLQPACAAITLKIAIVDCYPSVWNEAAQSHVCDPEHPAACCLDANPCSIETCEWMTGGDTPRFECRFAPTAEACCQSDLECPGPGRICDPATHQCTGGEPPPDTTEPAPEAVEAEPVSEVAEPLPDVPADTLAEAEPLPEAPAEPAPEVTEPPPEIVPELPPDHASEAAGAEPVPADTAVDTPSAEPGADPGPDGAAGGGCATSTATGSPAPLVPWLVFALAVAVRRRGLPSPRASS